MSTAQLSRQLCSGGRAVARPVAPAWNRWPLPAASLSTGQGRLLSAIAVALAFCLFCSCQTKQQGQAVSYPKHWPIAGLTVPSGSSAAPIHVFGPSNTSESFEQLGIYQDTNLYALGFTIDSDWQSIRDHIQNCLGSDYAVSLENDDPAVKQTNFTSKNGRYSVRLSGIKLGGMREFNYELLVYEYTDKANQL
ncbi:hypothetical protein IT575_07070 [bacterium]|nr:hypothetical protein [bacterium]